VAKRNRAPEADSSALQPETLKKRALIGFLVGVLLWIAATQFLVHIIRHIAHDLTFPVAGILGSWLAISRFHRLLWAACGLVVASFFVIGYTPLVSSLTRGWTRVDSLRKAPAVVVLAADSDLKVKIGEAGQARLLHGYEVVQQGYAPVLVVSRGASERSWIPAIREQMDRLAIGVPLIETPRVKNTHDEAIEVAKIARSRGWREVVLVTSPVHMPRSAATFEKAGVQVIASPCPEWDYNVEELSGSHERIITLREWLHEVIGCWVYRRRGWMD